MRRRHVPRQRACEARLVSTTEVRARQDVIETDVAESQIFSRSASSMPATLDDLEDLLIQSDLGLATTSRITDAIGKGRFEKGISGGEVRSDPGDGGRARADARRQAARHRSATKAARHHDGRRQRHRQRRRRSASWRQSSKRKASRLCSLRVIRFVPRQSISSRYGASGRGVLLSRATSAKIRRDWPMTP